MTTYAFPSITPTDSQFTLISNTRTFVSPITGYTQTVARKGSRWKVSLNFRNLDGDSRAELQAFLVKLDGQTHRFTLHDHAYTRRGTGNNTGAPAVNGASQLGSSLILNNATASVTNWLRAGDYLGVNNQLFMVTDDCNSDGSGGVTVNIKPPIRTSPADTATVDISAPITGVFMLANDASWSNTAGVFSNFTLEAIEDIA